MEDVMYKSRHSFVLIVFVLSLLAGSTSAHAAPLDADRGPWAAGVSYTAGDTVTYSGLTYQALQSHSSLTGWEPPNVPALWQVLSGPTNTSGPVSTVTRTPTRTNTPGMPTSTPTSGAGGGCWSAWLSTTQYTGGAQVSRNSVNYQAAYWTQGNDPATSNGPAGSGQPWIPMGSCGGVVTSTFTRTNTPAAATFTATRTNTPVTTTITFTRTATRTNTPVGPTATASATPSRTRTSTPGGSGGTCVTPWNATTAYVTDNRVSDAGHNYKANWWNQGERPSTSVSGVWTDQGTCTPPTAGPTAQPGTGFPARVSVIYADISFTSVQAAYQSTGHKYYALSFILGNAGTCVPAWDGTHFMSENYYSAEINAIRAAGGDVVAVFGGANGSDMASVCTTEASLRAAYQAVINQYRFTWIDLNIEGGMVNDTASVDRRNKVIKQLQDANPGLKVSYTLPVLRSGLPQGELNVLSNAKANGVRIDYVNIMTMNYGPAGIDMGQGAIEAATNTRSQLLALGISSPLGITPMNGQNNTQGEIFDLSDADELIAFARANSYVGWLSFWSLGRDNGGCAGQTTASASCSGITQAAYAFTNKFKAFP
jgi:chitinase